MRRRTTCKQCKKVIPVLAVLAGDPFCSSKCCRKRHGCPISAHVPGHQEDGHYKPNAGIMGSYSGESDSQLTRKQREARVRDRIARDALSR